jgi:hypothetical protein
MRMHSTIPALALLAFAGAAHASIIGFTGPVEQIAPPTLVSPGVDYATIAGDATVWDEQQNVFLTGVAVDMINNPGSSASPVAGTLTAPVDAHFFHLLGGSGAPVQGTITFSGSILGVAFDWPTLNNSDSWVAPIGTTYDTLPPRGIDPLFELITVSGNALTFDMTGAPHLLDTAQFRVFTEVVPAPSSLMPLLAGGMLPLRRRRRVSLSGRS